MMANEDAEPDLTAALRAMTTEFRGPGSWEFADEVLTELAGRHPYTNLDQLVAALFRDGTLTGDRANYDDPNNSFVDHCLTTGKGLPITLSLIARLVAERVGIRCSLIGLPGHVVIGAPLDTHDWQFFDPFNNGRGLSREECVSIAAMSGLGSAESSLRPMSNRAIVIRVLNNLARTFQRRRDAVGLSRCVAFRLAMPEIRRADASGTMALVRELN